MKPIERRTPEVCPVCGEDVPVGSLACPECGADHHSGWRDDASAYDGTDVPGPDFDYDQFIREEFGSTSKLGGIKPLWWITAVLLVIVLSTIYLYS